MSLDDACRSLASAIRSHTERRASAARQSSSGTVAAVDPLEIDVEGADLTLDDEDLIVGADVAGDLNVGDLVTLTEVSEGSWAIVARHG